MDEVLGGLKSIGTITKNIDRILRDKTYTIGQTKNEVDQQNKMQQTIIYNLIHKLELKQK